MSKGAAEQLVGRDRDLAILRGAIDDTESGPGSVVILGEPGIGKTTLWRSALSDAADRGYRVCQARAAQGEAQFSLAALGDLLDGVEETVLQALPPPRRRALAAALLIEDAVEPLPPRALAVSFLAAMRALASDGPLVVAVDDVHWLDPTTLDLLSFAARRLKTDPVLFLLAARDDSAATALRLAQCLPQSKEIRVGPLTLGALAAILRQRLEFSPTRPVLRKLAERSGGNPFFALELGRALRERGGDSVSDVLPVPQTLQALVQERLGSLPSEVRDALLVAAVGLEPELGVLEAALGGPVELGPATEASVLDLSRGTARFTHPLLAAAVVDAADSARLREIHARLVGLVTEPEQRARHLAAAAVGPDESVATELDAASARAESRGAHPAAAELAELALALTDPADTVFRARRAGRAGRRLTEVGDAVRGGELMRLAIDLLPRGPGRAAAIETLLDSAAATGDPVALGGEALEQAESDELRARLHVALAEVQLVRGRFDVAIAHAYEAERLARCGTDSALLILALGRTANLETLLGVGDPEEGFAEALQHEARLKGALVLSAVKSPRNHYARRLFWRDDLDQARPLFDGLRLMAIETAMDDCRPNVCLYLARLELRAGRPEFSERYVAEAFELARSAGYPQVLGAAFGVRALVAAYVGDPARARALLGESAERTRSIGDRWHTLHNRVTAGLLEASLGRYAETLDAVGSLAEDLDELGIAEPGIFPFEGDAIEAAAALGRADDAERLIYRLESRPRPRTLAVAARGRGLLLAGSGDLDAAADRFEEALRHHDELPDPLEKARTLLAFGTALRRARRRREARRALDASLALSEQAGASIFAGRARAELDRLGGRRTSAGLTPTEARVADLLTDGLSNKEIAATLVVSVSAVEAHLTRIYAKLGLRSRAQLARAFPTQTTG
jgi:DNA-binding CsgD family transcriptional regulator